MIVADTNTIAYLYITATNPLKQNNCSCVSRDGLLQAFGKVSFVITSDKKIINAFPGIAQTIHDFIG